MPPETNASFLGKATLWWQAKKQPQLRERYQKELYFVIIMGLAAFYYTAIASYHPADPSPVSLSFPSADVQNLAGQIGALISGLSFYLLGIACYLLPLPFIFTALLLLFNVAHSFSRARLLGLVCGYLGLTAIITLWLTERYIDGVAIPAGGLLGDRLATLLLNFLGEIGSLIALVTIMLASVVAITRKGVITQMCSWITSHLAPFFPRSVSWPKLNFWRRDSGEMGPVTTSSTALSPPLSMPHLVNEPVLSRPETPSLSLEKTDETQAKLNHLKLDNAPNELDFYTPPPTSIFRSNPAVGPLTDKQKREFEQTAQLLTQSFADFSINGSVVAIQPGPVVTVFEFQPDAGTKISRILGLIDDIALALKVDAVLMHPVRGKSAIGIQVPNKRRDTVFLGDIVNTKTFRDESSPLTIAMGKSLAGEAVCADLTSMPHLLMAGATGAGKSVAINALLCSIILKATPREVRMILVDPKMLELSMYEDIPHLMMPVITDAKKASSALRWATFEMERRYRLMQLAKVRNIQGFNDYWQRASRQERQDLQLGAGEEQLESLPYILLVIDELADLMMMAPKDVEASIQRLAQKARASGIHLVLATQRPSVDIITGVIKANLPCRVAFQTVSKHDSRTILDQVGSEKLLGKGDMLFLKPGQSRLERIQGAFIGDEEVTNLVATLKESSSSHYDESAMNWIERESEKSDSSTFEQDPADDDVKWDEAVAIATRHGAVSASFLQRQLKIGYNRAARIVESMAAQGLVGEADGAKPRRWLGPTANHD